MNLLLACWLNSREGQSGVTKHMEKETTEDRRSNWANLGVNEQVQERRQIRDGKLARGWS